MSKKKKGLSDKVRLAKTKKSKSTSLNKIHNNPFEVKTNKQKHKILGRKTKHDRGMPGISRSKANKKRVDTLLREYQQRNKTNIIQDERLGVNDEQITLEEKMLQRFALERKKKHDKLAQFNLNDDEELTHLGQSLSTMDKFDDYVDSDDDENNGAISREYVEHAHFGGGIFKKKVEDESEEKVQHKTRKDVIEEIIAKSKAAKFEKQTAKDESEELRGKLDDAWGDLQQLLKSSIRTPLDKEIAKDNSKPDDYDRVVKQMLFDRKAAPAEREKTKEEIAAEKEAELKKQEEDRLARMQMDADDKNKHQSADALDDEFANKIDDEEVGMLAYPLFDDAAVNDEDEDDDVSGSEERDSLDMEGHESEVADQGIVDDGASLDAEEEEEESDSYSDIDSGNEDGMDILSWEDNPEDRAEDIEEESQEIPEAPSKFPSSYAEFFALVAKLKEEPNAAAMVTDKLRKNYAPALRKGNKAKMIELFAFVWEHCCKMASLSPPRLDVISSLTSHLYDLCSMNTESCSQCVVERLKRSYHFCFSSGKAKRPQWPSLEIMVQFKLTKLFYSTSDFNHSVATRALTFMCNIINVCRIASQRDVARGLFLCTIMYEFVCFSKRLIPECLNFLVVVLSMTVPLKRQQKFGLPEVATPRLNKSNCNLLALKKKSEIDNEKVNLIELLQEEIPQDSDLVKCQLAITALRIGEKFASLYSGLSAYDELFSPLKQICNLMTKSKRNSSKLVEYLQTLLQEIEKNCNQPRKYLSTGPKKPKPLRLFDHKIENPGEPFDRRSSKKNQSVAKRERDRLIHKRRREMKGAMREIRKDSKFISRQRQKEQDEMDEERAAKVKRLYGLLSNQEGEVKNIERRKYKLDL